MSDLTQPGKVIVDGETSRQHGLPAITISVDTVAAGMFSRQFPREGALVALSGTQGSYSSVFVWDCTDISSLPLEDMIRAHYTVGRLGRAIEPIEIGTCSEAPWKG